MGRMEMGFIAAGGQRVSAHCCTTQPVHPLFISGVALASSCKPRSAAELVLRREACRGGIAWWMCVDSDARRIATLAASTEEYEADVVAALAKMAQSPMIGEFVQ